MEIEMKYKVKIVMVESQKGFIETYGSAAAAKSAEAAINKVAGMQATYLGSEAKVAAAKAAAREQAVAMFLSGVAS
jgi:hypothetical protein